MRQGDASLERGKAAAGGMPANVAEPTVANRGRRRWKRRPTAFAAGLFLLGLLLTAVGAPLLAPYAASDRDEPFAWPSTRHWCGADANGYDVLTRLIYGSRLSLLAAGASMFLAAAIGAPAGAIAGYFGRTVDAVLMRAVDIWLAFPGILIAFLAAAVYQQSWAAVIFAVAMINAPLFARQVRATVLGVRELDYVLASRALGAGHGHILWRIVAPSAVSPVIVLSTLGLGGAILEVAGLSFLGINGDVSQPEWGAMLGQAKDHLQRSFWPVLFPGLAISTTVLAFNLFGDGVRDALDPHER